MPNYALMLGNPAEVRAGCANAAISLIYRAILLLVQNPEENTGRVGKAIHVLKKALTLFFKINIILLI